MKLLSGKFNYQWFLVILNEIWLLGSEMHETYERYDLKNVFVISRNLFLLKVLTNWWKMLVQSATGQRPGSTLYHVGDGFYFRVNRQHLKTVYMRCASPGCKVTGEWESYNLHICNNLLLIGFVWSKNYESYFLLFNLPRFLC